MEKMNVLEKAEMVKELVRKEIGEFDDDRLRKMIRKIGKGIRNDKEVGKTTRLTPAEVSLYALFYKNGLKPDTVYRWFIVDSMPEDAKEKVRVGVWGLRKAYGEKRKLCSYDNTNTEDFINAVIRCVEMFYVEPDVERDMEVEA